jgi:predicted RNA-binding protein with PUA domain
MAKFEEVFQDTQALFNNFMGQIENLSGVNIKILAQNRLKEIGKVVKANDLVKHMTNEDIIILLNEQIFEQLDEEQKLMVVEELIARIYFDSEKEKLSIVSPDVNTFSLLLRKYGYDKYEVLHESIKALFSQESETEAENNQ